jgi:hypothetical protein
MRASKERYYDFAEEADSFFIRLDAEADLMGHRLEAAIQNMALSGMSEDDIISTVKNDLRDGGPLTSPIRSNLLSRLWSGVDDFAQGAVFDDNPDTDTWEWLTTSGRPCEDCEPRHGMVKAYEQWRSAGLPRSGFSRCQSRCKCVLVPDDRVEPEFGGPVIVDTIQQFRDDFKSRLASDPALRRRVYKK